MVQPPQTTIKLLSDCSFDQAVRIWNLGFQGYRVDMTVSLESYLARLHDELISLECSFVAFVLDEPVGFLLNGVRVETTGRKLAWNGGTGVSPQFRRTGVGRLLM